MKRKTSIASGIDAARDKAAYDAACKRLLSEKIILAWILKSCAAEFRDLDVAVIASQCIEGQPYVAEVPVAPDETAPVILGMNTEQASPTEGSVFFDIYFSARVPGTEKIVQLVINVEVQAKFHPGYPLTKRGIFYCARMISSQAGFAFQSSQYGKLKKTYSIWICTDPPQWRENTITQYRMCEENIIGNDHEPVEHYDLLTLVMIHLKAQSGNQHGHAPVGTGQNADENRTSGSSETEAADGNEHGSDASLLRLLNTLLASDTSPAEKKRILEDEFDIPMTQSMDREVSLMCNLSQSIEDRGIQQGFQQGIQQGTLISLKSLMKTTGWPFDKAISSLEVPKGQWEIYAKLLCPTPS